MLNRKKSQAAMEFLMTYGWALLVVLLAIGALSFFGLLSPDNFLPDKVDVSNRAIAIYPTETNAILVLNNGPEVLYNVSFNFTSANCLQTQGKDIPTGEREKFMIWCNDVPPKNKKFKSDFNIYYYTKTKGHNIDHVANGKYVVTGNYVSSNGLVGYWPFDDSGDFNDYSGQGNDGTAEGDAKINNGALKLDGDGDYVNLGSVKEESTESYSFWFKLKCDGLNNNADYGLISFDSDISGDGIFIHDVTFSNKPQLALSRGNVNSYAFYNNNMTKYFDNEWHHIVIVILGSAESDVQISKAYVDNLEFNPDISDSWGEDEAVYDEFYIGVNNNSLDFNGSIDQVMIFERLLTEDEIKSLYQAGR